MTRFVRDIYNRVWNIDRLNRGGWCGKEWIGHFGKHDTEAHFDCDPTQEGERIILPGNGLAKAFHYDSDPHSDENFWSATSEIIAWSINPAFLEAVTPICIDGLQDISTLIFVVRNGKRWEEIGRASYSDEELTAEARKRAATERDKRQKSE